MADTNVARIRPVDEKSFRLAPHNIEAEQALLGAILVNNEAFYRVSDFLMPEHFYEPVHKKSSRSPARSSAPARPQRRSRPRPICPTN